jgi:hypothetical protein
LLLNKMFDISLELLNKCCSNSGHFGALQKG